MSSMFNITRKSIEWGGKTLTLETGKVARQSDGAVVISYDDVVILCTVVSAKKPKPDIDFFPLTVHYQEKTYAAGKIPGGFFKREGRPSERETLTSRLIDRPIRPLFPDEFRNETQIICTLLSTDRNTIPDVLALIGTSAALTISGIPFMGPVGAARVGYIDGEYVLNPSMVDVEISDLDLVVAGTQSSVLMVESEAKELSEEMMLGAVMYGHREMQKVIDLIIDFAECCAKEPWDVQQYDQWDAVCKQAKAVGEKAFREAYKLTNKQERSTRLYEIRAEIVSSFEAGSHPSVKISDAIKKLEMDIVRNDLIDTKKRIDGRGLSDVRRIEAEVSFLPATHGSALFTRGETQAVVVTTLGTSQDEQIIDALEGEYKERFMLHYNFPPYSVGEASPMRAPGRREIGHGKLAWRAIRPLLPTQEDFPYTIRVVSDITESNGSSSMATVCGSSLAMMDAGVPLPRPVAGIAMGLIKEADKFVVLSDILGDEDHLGDMDFKVAGTSKGVTALQMDIKINGITEEIMQVALGQAHEGRKTILAAMDNALNEARGGVSKNAPAVTTMQINRDKIREVIGSGGKVIREICEKTGAKVDIEDDGSVRIYAQNADDAKAAYDWIYGIVAEPEVGKIYDGEVVTIVDFGAFVRFFGAQEGLVHVSQISVERVADVSSVLHIGDKVKVKLMEMDRGKFRLSMKVVDQETGEIIAGMEDEMDAGGSSERRPRSDRPRREKRS
jgi:polyribonucleotide nucleotidyltransferase